MIKIFEKRGRWCYRDANGKLHKFSTEAEAKSSLNLVEPEEVEDASEEEESYEETFYWEEETDTDEQEIVCDGESDGEEEV